MKILAIEKEIPGVDPDSIKPFLKAEAVRVWELYRSGIVREHYFDLDRHRAVLILECMNGAEARALLATLPLVIAQRIDFDIYPLTPYTGFGRLLGERD